jgi:hypothetical protein
MRAWRRSSGAQRAAALGLLVLVVLWLPGTIAADVRGLRSSLELSARGRAETAGPGARAGSDSALLRLAGAKIPSGAAFAVVTTRAWRERRSGAVREAGAAWTRFVLAPRAQVAPRAAHWVLVLGASPRAAGVGDGVRTWRTGGDWLVQTR